MGNTIKIPGRLESVVYEHSIGDSAVAGAGDIFDDTIGAYQNQINYDINRNIANIEQQIATIGGVNVTQYTSANINVTMGPDSIGIWDSSMSNLNITLVAPEDVTKAAIYTCLITTSASPNVVFTAQGGEQIIMPSGFQIAPSCINEVQIMYAGGKFYIRSINY